MFAGDRAVDLAEFFEDEIALLLGDSDAGVGDADLDIFGVCGLGVYFDAAFLGGEFDGVAEEVKQDLLEFAAVGFDEFQIRIDVQVYLEFFFFDEWAGKAK